MHAEEYTSRYSEMFYDLEAANREKFENRQKIEDYTNLANMMQTVTNQRDQVIKELDEAKEEIGNLEIKNTDYEADIARLVEKHEQDLKDKKEEHNVEINELEQKLQKERIEIANMKASRMKE